MKNLSLKTDTLATLISLGSLLSTSSHAAILRSTDGAPVLTKDGACVITNWEGSEGCDAAKKMMNLPTSPMGAPCAPMKGDNDKAVYFDFNKSTLRPHAQHRLDHLAKKIEWMCKHGNKETITIVGYADRLGDAAYNEKLAMKRAEAVRDYLLAQGVKAQKIEVRSLGKTAPKAECAADMPRAKLIECLHEDRRVEIEFNHDAK